MGMRDTIFKAILKSAVGKRKYLYSDLGFYFMQRILQNITGKDLDQLATENFFAALGAYKTCYRPLEKFSADQIVPTENDRLFRKQLLQGFVHDQGAALLGGVAGHAGLFSNAVDLAKVFQMYLNQGEYGGERFLDAETIQEFSRCQFCAEGNRRALGFDRSPGNGNDHPACNCVSYVSFGHSGFTGTLAWVDPPKELLFIFLSNRIHPDAENRKIITQGIRAAVQQAVYNHMAN
jgi:beta-N-acetylhexosaminidase